MPPPRVLGSLSLAVCSWFLGSQALAVFLSVLLNTRESDLCFTAAVSATNLLTLILRRERHLLLHPPPQRVSHAVPRCDSSSAGEYCLAASPPHSDLSPSSKLVAPNLTQAIRCRRGRGLPLTPDLHSTYISFCSSENVCSSERTQQPVAVHGLSRSNPPPSAWSS